MFQVEPLSQALHVHRLDGVVCVGLADFSHISAMFDNAKMRSGFYDFFHFALLNDFGSFALWMSHALSL